MGWCSRLMLISITLIAILFGWTYRLATTQNEPDLVSLVEKEGGAFIKLKDGRILEYFEAGDRNAKDVIVYVHGALQSGKLVPEIFEKIKFENPVRIIAPSIAGHGKSTGYLGRKIVDFGYDVEQLMEKLQINRFHVIGISMGSPHAVSVVDRMNEKVGNVALLVPVSGIQIPLMLEEAAAKNSSVEKILVPLFTTPYVGEVFSHLIASSLSSEQAILDFFKQGNPADFNELENSPYKTEVLHGIIRSRNLTSIGYGQGLALMNEKEFSAFDFKKISSIKNRKFLLYVGEKDSIAPPKNGDWYKSKIPISEIIVTKGVGHFGFSTPKRISEVVLKLIQE